jgi:hypothetical protein
MIEDNFITSKTDDDLLGCLELTEDYLMHCTYPKADSVQYLKALYTEAKNRMPDYVSPYEGEHTFFRSLFR